MTTITQFLTQWGPHHPGPHGPMGPSSGMGAGGAWSGFGLLPVLGLLLVLLTILALGAYLIFRIAHDGDGDVAARSEDDALTTLRERFARGEIDVEEFEKRRGRLTD